MSTILKTIVFMSHVLITGMTVGMAASAPAGYFIDHILKMEILTAIIPDVIIEPTSAFAIIGAAISFLIGIRYKAKNHKK